jgi:hypothetical protein
LKALHRLDAAANGMAQRQQRGWQDSFSIIAPFLAKRAAVAAAKPQMLVVHQVDEFPTRTWQGCPPLENGKFFWKTDEALAMQIQHNIAQAILAAPPLRWLYLPLIKRYNQRQIRLIPAPFSKQGKPGASNRLVACAKIVTFHFLPQHQR